MDNSLLSSLDSNTDLTDKAKAIEHSLDMITSAIVGRLISERLIAYDGQPGQAIEYLAACVADTLVDSLSKVDTIEMRRFWDSSKNEKGTR